MGLRGKMAQQVVSALGFFPSDGSFRQNSEIQRLPAGKAAG